MLMASLHAAPVSFIESSSVQRTRDQSSTGSVLRAPIQVSLAHAMLDISSSTFFCLMSELQVLRLHCHTKHEKEKIGKVPKEGERPV
jgi:hypothetical protein